MLIRKIILLASLAVFSLGTVSAQEYIDSTYTPAKQRNNKQKTSFGPRIYWGGTFGLSFGSYTSILVEPLVGYRFTKKLSVGVGAGIRYGKDNQRDIEFTNYIGRTFARYIIVPNFYVHLEYMLENYDEVFYFEGKNPLDYSRTTVPFLFAGGGLRRPVGAHSSFIVQVLFNVLQDNPYSRQVYPAGSPLISIGFISGF